jgi:hypothetical protein
MPTEIDVNSKSLLFAGQGKTCVSGQFRDLETIKFRLEAQKNSCLYNVKERSLVLRDFFV